MSDTNEPGKGPETVLSSVIGKAKYALTPAKKVQSDQKDMKRRARSIFKLEDLSADLPIQTH